MTNGSESGTTGWRRPEWGPWAAIALIAVVVAAVNISSEILESRRSGSDLAWWEPAIWEVSSLIVIVAIAPFVGLAIRRWPPQRDRLLRSGLIHFALTVPFAVAHVAGIFIMRNAAYGLAGRHYGYFDDGLGVVLLYEWRKDVLGYAVVAGVYWIFRYAAERRAAPPSLDDRIEIRDDGAATYLPVREILFVEAAGNYVEIHAAVRTHLVRGTLAAWQERLVPYGFARVHRSRLVNRERVMAARPNRSGDMEITLDDGRTLLGSRRYRTGLELGMTA